MLEEVPADLLLQDFGLSITAGAVSGIGILDRNSEIILGGQVVMVDYMVTCRTGQFGTLQYGSAIIIDGVRYNVRHEALRLADGLYCSIPLELSEFQGGAEGNSLITDTGDRLVTLSGDYLVVSTTEGSDYLATSGGDRLTTISGDYLVLS
jgi:hypothetical protein